MALPIPAAPFLADPALWARAANNLVGRAEGLLRDELEWRRARPCLMAEYFRLAVEEDRKILNPWRRARHRHWRRRCLAENTHGKTMCSADLDSSAED